MPAVRKYRELWVCFQPLRPIRLDPPTPLVGLQPCFEPPASSDNLSDAACSILSLPGRRGGVDD